MRHYAGNRYVKQALEDWDSLFKLARKRVSVKQGMSKKSVWELLERLAPIQIKGYIETEQLVVRVLYNKVDKKYYLDLRIFQMFKGKLRRTDKGVYFPIETYKGIYKMIDELTRRYK